MLSGLKRNVKVPGLRNRNSPSAPVQAVCLLQGEAGALSNVYLLCSNRLSRVHGRHMDRKKVQKGSEQFGDHTMEPGLETLGNGWGSTHLNVNAQKGRYLPVKTHLSSVDQVSDGVEHLVLKWGASAHFLSQGFPGVVNQSWYALCSFYPSPSSYFLEPFG